MFGERLAPFILGYSASIIWIEKLYKHLQPFENLEPFKHLHAFKSTYAPRNIIYTGLPGGAGPRWVIRTTHPMSMEMFGSMTFVHNSPSTIRR